MSNQSAGGSKADRRDAARERALAIQKEQERREKRSRLIVLISVIAGVVVVALLAFFILNQQKQPVDPNVTSFPADVDVPSTADASGGFTLFKGEAVTTQPEGVPVVDLYLDFMCPHCADFEALNSGWLLDKADAGEMAYRVHPIAILGSPHSVTIGAAFASLLETDPELGMKFGAAAFAAQNTGGLNEATMRSMMSEIGVPSADIDKAVSGKYERFIEAASNITLNNESLRDNEGRFGTPALFLNGKRWDVNWTQVDEFKAALADAAPASGPIGD